MMDKAFLMYSLYLFTHCHEDSANFNIYSLVVSAHQRCTIGASTAALLISLPFPIMNRNKMRLGAEADNMGRCPGGYSRLSARQAAVADCGQL